MRFRPCIDIHNGKVKQIVGSSLRDKNDEAKENYVASNDAVFYARMYREMGLSGGHIILLNPVTSPLYEATKKQATEALNACPGLMQVGGGITADNAKEFIDAGASHVIVTSYVFKDGKINYANLEKLTAAVGKEKVVLDLSCKNVDGKYYIVTDRWQKLTDVELTEATLDLLSEYCDEFLVHAADVEGKQKGIEENVAGILGKWGKIPVTYAGGAGTLDDVKELKEIGKGRVDVTIGSALEIFGGSLKLKDVIEICD
ncbi:MAG: phosphoribosylformimino-5-aminoimidazole carboxamide ribotide isomerase [Lachnospiraceae bacterium]|jgi:phosphoribosylformimino-5-aminoimidazole carboxamide ribotide isomerase|uniref:phosphoribosylformimino-5-aminoimidazole carboxamide ribotide isomerase n=1 Tax=Butyrivibrio sp. LB2008 TaxID=1408305 RepID=UPI00047ADFCE|nr:phosphoribosylformimino-5-aminoimidazole carboxamide ribotide isomerase [Butyrivibrio sp. LB2008]MBO7386840.1 phosphoribosylformimino-5-aminoimidazole carboxamide ribotide isomerase [Lachnospiraceae bacterium]MBP5299625.1 phosphoribosylformimino-5-aminoimidazole carboxamide ribotide isomerase [Lachnospiraceae bacterium]MEE3495335.1 phosphoribosylformimino-5-aminoimidazole carboxamide ribotide isomerase [Butyrivibrio sp.]